MVHNDSVKCLRHDTIKKIRDAGATEIDPRHILSRRFDHENISTVVFPLSLIQEK